jgi:hypothetical protein
VSILLAMNPSRHQIAAGVTVVALGALATVALASGGTPSKDTVAAPTATQSAPEVRTEIVRETIHRRAKRSGSGSSGRSVSASSGPSRAATAPATAAVAPVSTPDQRRGRGGDDDGADDHGGRGRDDEGVEDHGGGDDDGHGRSGDDD